MKLFILFVFLCYSLLGCTLRNDKSSAVKDSDEATPFEISPIEKEKLAAANCQITQSLVNCLSPSEQPSSLDRLASLQSHRTKLVDQKLALESLHANLESQLQSGVLTGRKFREATILKTVLSLIIPTYVAKIATKDAEILSENQYLTVLGTKCQGNFSHEGTVQKIDELIGISDKANSGFSRTFGVPNNPQFEGKLDSADGTRLRWEASDRKTGDPDSKVKHFVETDGEFTLQTSDSAKLNIDCFHRRTNSVDFEITDRPTKDRTLNCHAEFVGPAIDHKGKPILRGRLALYASENEENQVTEIGVKSDSHWQDGDYEGINYAIKYTSNKGLMKFEAYDIRSEQVLMEITTVNSTQKITFGYSDQTGNSLKLDCGEGQ
ncbi:MAG: hypothetical protein JNM39_17515 [Bdellovibrionaceae bacterium]|nr:hypothetical protein [Pseudobdellovibrionaceae bacterium]